MLRTPIAMSVVPSRKSLMTIWILARINQDDRAIERLCNRSIVRSQKLVEDLDSRLKCCRLIPVDAIGEPDNDRRRSNQILRIAGIRLSRVGQFCQLPFDLV